VRRYNRCTRAAAATDSCNCCQLCVPLAQDPIKFSIVNLSNKYQLSRTRIESIIQVNVCTSLIIVDVLSLLMYLARQALVVVCFLKRQHEATAIPQVHCATFA
jgi:hypothetical protein